MARLKRLPSPTSAFNKRKLPIVRVPKNHRWVRLHRSHHGAVFYGNTGDNRFDSIDGAFGTLYLARHINGAFVEVFCRQRERRLTETRLEQYRVAEFQVARGLKLIDLAGKGLVRMGLDGRLATGNYQLAQQWSLAFYEHPDQADGILYPSLHDPKQQLAALFDRTQALLTVKQQGSLRDYLGDDFFPLLGHYDVALLE